MNPSPRTNEVDSWRCFWKRRFPVLILIFALAFTVRILTANFIREHFDDPGWFQAGSYRVFDINARDILDGKSPVFWIDDPTRTDKIVYPPGYPLWIAAIYRISGDRSPFSVQKVQVVLDSLSVLLLVGIGVAAFDWGTGLAAGFLGALSPLLALAGATPTADAPAGWLVLAAVWCFLLAAKKKSVVYVVSAGGLLGLACWFRVNPLFVFLFWGAALVLLVNAAWRKRLVLAAAVSLSALVMISPVVIRNVMVFYPDIAPTGLGVGWNLLAGIGETERGPEFGVPCCDDGIVEQERTSAGISEDARFELYYPDGIRRDRDRGRRAICIISDHPLWFADVMINRLWGHLKFAGKPAPNVGSAGFNVTSNKTLPPDTSGLLATVVNILGMVQSVWRYLALPLMIAGMVLAFRSNKPSTVLLGSTILYYLITLGIGHSEIRYGLPMQAILIVFAGVTLMWLLRLIIRNRIELIGRGAKAG